MSENKFQKNNYSLDSFKLQVFNSRYFPCIKQIRISYFFIISTCPISLEVSLRLLLRKLSIRYEAFNISQEIILKVWYTDTTAKLQTKTLPYFYKVVFNLYY